MTQTQIQSAEYWESGFSLSDTDFEQIYNHFLETEKPQTVADLAGLVIRSRVREQAAEVRRLMAGTVVYQPQRSYSVGDEVIFPALKLAKGKVTAVRPGYNPEYGDFNVITVSLKGKPREFVADYSPVHVLNNSNGGELTEQMAGDAQAILDAHGATVAARVAAALDDIARQHCGEDVLVVSHGLALATVLCRVHGHALGRAYDLIPPHTAPVTVVWTPG